MSQITSILANGQAADTSDGSGLTWQGWPACPTVIRVNGGLTLNRPAPAQAKDDPHRCRTGQYSGVLLDWSVSNRGR